MLVVGVLLIAAHVVATVLSYGPATLVVDRRLAALWVRRGLLALVPMPITYVAVRGPRRRPGARVDCGRWSPSERPSP